MKGLNRKKLAGVNAAFLLNRVSDISQKDGFSLPAQSRHGTEYITETASKTRLRTNFDSMVQDVTRLATMSSRPVNLVVEKIDRLSRDFTSKETL